MKIDYITPVVIILIFGLVIVGLVVIGIATINKWTTQETEIYQDTIQPIALVYINGEPSPVHETTEGRTVRVQIGQKIDLEYIDDFRWSREIISVRLPDDYEL